MRKQLHIIIAALIMTGLHVHSYGQAKIQAYFNHPVNNSLSTGVNAIYLPSGSMADTIVAYINRAQHTLDIAEYDYNQDTYDGAYANIAAAVNNAYSRGVVVRWIYDGSSSNTGISLLNSGIATLASPTTSSGIMHNKFIIIDANDGNPRDAILCTGSEDWSSEMFYNDYNNILFIEDSALANAYTQEFNMMWGSTGPTPNISAAKFGTEKTDLGLHSFIIGGKQVYLYFSPSDNANTQLENAIATANTDLYLAMYDLTETANADAIAEKNSAGVYSRAILDQYSHGTTAYNIISDMGAGHLVEYTGYYIYHNKMLIVDPSDTCSDPIVETGSENWTSSGTSYNDENILIIHSDTLANIYYQSFYKDFTSLGGSLSTVAGCGAVYEGVQNVAAKGGSASAYPSPSSGEVTFRYEMAAPGNAKIFISDALGRCIATVADAILAQGTYSCDYWFSNPGVYTVSFRLGDVFYARQVVIL